MNMQHLKGRIIAAGYTQKTLAPLLEMSENTLSNKLNSKTSFNTKEVNTLCDLLGIVDAAEKVDIFLS